MSTALDSFPDARRAGERLWTAGQPDAAQLATAAVEGIRCVINLALPSSPRALPDERAMVEAAGMEYVHIPVLFDQPTEADYLRFESELDRRSGQPLLIHCARNFRVSAFIAVYRVRRQGWTRGSSLRDLETFWKPEPAWAALLDVLLR
jgi:uncharacterized protein (TIGR01244 family)